MADASVRRATADTAVALLDADQTAALAVLTAGRERLTEATAVALMARAVAIDRDVTRLTAAAAAAADAKDYAAEAAAEADLTSLMASPQRWVEVPVNDKRDHTTPAPPQLFRLLCTDDELKRRPDAVFAWVLRALLALRVPVPVPVPVPDRAATSDTDTTSPPPPGEDESVLALDRACVRQQVTWHCPLQHAIDVKCHAMAHAILDLPARAYGVDVNARDPATNRSAVRMACANPLNADSVNVPLATRLLHRSSPDTVNCRVVGPDIWTPSFQPLLHVQIARLALTEWAASAPQLLEVCCSESVCPSDGTGLDPLTPDTRGGLWAPPLVTTADALDDAERRAAALAFERDPMGLAAAREGCALVRRTVARLTAYAQGFAPALSGALRDCGVAVPAPVQGIVAGYAFKASPYTSQWPASASASAE